MALNIECKIHRRWQDAEGNPVEGSDIDIGGTLYRFRPNDKGAHVCEVTDSKHIQRFLQIPEAYQIYEGGEPTPPSAPEVPEEDTGFEVVTELVDEGPSGSPGKIPVAIEDPDGASNKALEQWAVSRGIAFKNKGHIEDYAKLHFQAGLDRRMNVYNMIRELVKLENAKG